MCFQIRDTSPEVTRWSRTKVGLTYIDKCQTDPTQQGSATPTGVAIDSNRVGKAHNNIFPGKGDCVQDIETDQDGNIIIKSGNGEVIGKIKKDTDNGHAFFGDSTVKLDIHMIKKLGDIITYQDGIIW